MDSFVADLKYLIKPKSTIVRDFKEEFSWIKKTALKQHYYTYHGSLTTTPYSECVIWIIFTRPIRISRRQVNKKSVWKKINFNGFSKKKKNVIFIPSWWYSDR